MKLSTMMFFIFCALYTPLIIMIIKSCLYITNDNSKDTIITLLASYGICSIVIEIILFYGLIRDLLKCFMSFNTGLFSVCFIYSINISVTSVLGISSCISNLIMLIFKFFLFEQYIKRIDYENLDDSLKSIKYNTVDTETP